MCGPPLQCYHLFLYSRCLRTDQLTTNCAFSCLLVFLCFVCVLCLVLCVCFVAGLFLHGVSQWIVYWSISVLFCMHIVVTTDVATALIRWICKRHLYFRLDKRPGESHLALDGKKVVFSNLVAVFHSCLASPFNLFGPWTVNSFVHISETRWA